MKKGTVKWFNNEKGYGFIIGEDGKDIFVHYSGIKGDGFRTLDADQKVEYRTAQGERGITAVDVTVIE
jgi:CspA family cold shock protein